MAYLTWTMTLSLFRDLAPGLARGSSFRDTLSAISMSSMGHGFTCAEEDWTAVNLDLITAL
eukprot:6269079-Amphidinium_carterae.1